MGSWLNIFTYPRNHALRAQGSDTIALLPLLTDDEVTEGTTVIVYDGDPDSKRYKNEGELRSYLEQFPEANNDQATRIFQYGPDCGTTLKLALFEKFPFLQFSLIPSGLTGMPGNAGLKIAVCGCERCKAGTLCSHRAMECAFSFWQYAATSIDSENRLEVTGNDQSFAIYAGGQKSTFQLEACSIQCFRFPPRLLEHTDRAFDTLLFSTNPILLKLTTVPLEYTLEMLDVIVSNWEKILNESSRFLSFFAVEVLSVRLGRDRRIIRHLLGAAQLWRSLHELVCYQISLVEPLHAFKSDNPWIEDSADPPALRARLAQSFTALTCHRDRINVCLIQETDLLIQRITNLISIDEGYHSRDANASIRRLSWITFIFLPMIFTSGLFGMNVDILESNPSWKYYLAFLFPVGIMIATVYWIFRNDFQIIRRISVFFLPQHETRGVQSEAMLDNSTVLAWAAATGQTTMLATFLNLNRRQVASQEQSGNDSSLISAITNGHFDTAQLLIRDPNVDVSAHTLDGSTALHLAAAAGVTDLLLLLLHRGVDPEVVNNENENALDIAIASRHDGCTAILLRTKYGILDDGGKLLSSLHYAAMAADIFTFIRLANNGFSFRETDSHGVTPIFYALEHCTSDFFSQALSLCPDMFVTDSRGFSLLHSAVELGKLDTVELLLERGLSVHQCSAGKLLTPLLLLSSFSDSNDLDDRPLARILLEHGADLNRGDAQGRTPAHYLAGKNTENSALLLQLLFEKGATFSLQDEDGNTPHHISCDVGNVRAMKILCNSPDGLSRRNNLGLSPGETAASGGHINIVSMMIDQQPAHIDLRATVRDIELWRVLLDKAISSDDWEKVQQIAMVARINMRDHEVAFQMAVMADAVSVTRNLLSIGCSLNWAAVRDGFYNSTLFQKALQRNCVRTVSILLENDVSIDGYDNSGWTALHSATSAENIDAVSRILPRIADRDHKDKDGWSALDLALWNRNEELIQLLDDGSPHTAPWTKKSSIYYSGCNFTTPEDVKESLELPAR